MAHLIRSVRARTRPQRWTGVSAEGMEYVVLGTRPRTILLIPGGPGSEIPSGFMARLEERQVRPYLEAGYAVWTVTRRRGMPPGHTVADMAADHACFIWGGDGREGGRRLRPVLRRAHRAEPGSGPP